MPSSNGSAGRPPCSVATRRNTPSQTRAATASASSSWEGSPAAARATAATITANDAGSCEPADILTLPS